MGKNKEFTKVKSVGLIPLLIFSMVIISFTFLIITNKNIFNEQDGIMETCKENYSVNLKKSDAYIESFIHIDGSIPGNWSNTVSIYDWCRGIGTWSNPYIIENVSIDASISPIGSGILINNSKNDYFIIRNCIISNGVNGINLENTNNGTLINNICSINAVGILLYNNCNNNTISGNPTNNNNLYGIYLNDNCKNNTISGNPTINNNQYGIYLRFYCYYNNIIVNIVSNNDYSGIYLNNNCNNNTILGNSISDNDEGGIHLNNCNDNLVSGNFVNRNYIVGIYLSNCDNNTILENISHDSELAGVFLEVSNNNMISGNIVKNNSQSGIYLYDQCNDNILSGNIVKNNSQNGINFFNSNYNVLLANIVSNNSQNGIYLAVCFQTNLSGNVVSNNSQNGLFLLAGTFNTISGNSINDNHESGIYLESCNDNLISGNIVNYNYDKGIYLHTYCYDNTISGNDVHENDIGITIGDECDSNNAMENYIYYNSLAAIYIDNTGTQYNVITKNVLVSTDEKFIFDLGTENIISMNYEFLSPPQLNIKTIYQSFSVREFNIVINASSVIDIDFTIEIIQIWWNGIVVPLDSIKELGNDLYNISLVPIFVELNEAPILMNMTISVKNYRESYFELYLAVEPYDIVKLLQLKMVDTFYSLEHFNFTFFLCDETEQAIDSTTIQMWWNGVDVSSDIHNLGNGYYFVSLESITVEPGEDPILLNMTISALGYEIKYFETYIAVDPISLQKGEGEPPKDVPLTLIVTTSTLSAGVVIGIAIVLLIRRRRK